ncbi:lipopolysaccharide biosynthesis protein [Cetobacterium somerae]
MSLKKSYYNSFFGIISMIVVGLITFIKISVIINTMGQEYNGLNNLYTQIFSFLMIGEAGIGLATTSILYEHIDNKDIREINKIISGSRKVLSNILGVIFIIAVVMSFFIQFLIKDNTLNNSFISLTFILFSSKLLFCQYFQPLKGYVAANQDEYLLKIYQILSGVIIGVGEILVLYLRKNYIEMLFWGMISSIVLEILNYHYLKLRYKNISFFFKEKNYEAKKYMKELVKVNIVGTIAKSIDPLIISKLLGLIITSLYSNYSYIQNFLLTLVGTALGGFTHYFGNIFVKKDIKRKEKFDKYILITNFLATFFMLMFNFMIQDFILLWINSTSKLDMSTGLLFSLLIYIYIIMKPINTLVTTNKLFKLISKSALYEVAINLIISLILIQKIGLNGVLIGSILSFLLTSFWYFPINTYKKILECSSFDYFYKQFKSILILAISFTLMNKVQQNYLQELISWKQFIYKGIINSLCCGILNLLLYTIFFKEIRQFFRIKIK